MKKYKYPSVLSIAGFDGSGGAGLQADIKTASALGCYSTSVLTALPVQNTMGVKNIFSIPNAAIEEQLATIFEDIFPNAIKIGMVHTSELVQTIVKTLHSQTQVPVVFDPVMVATSGHKLIEDDTIEVIAKQLIPLAQLITPNLDEAAILADMKIDSVEDMYRAGKRIIDLGAQGLLLKGGHLKTEKLTSLYFTKQGEVHEFSYEKYDTNNTHGSGCTLSSAIASYLARGESILEAVGKGQKFVHKAIYHGKDVQVGHGNGPLNHFFNPEKLIKNELER
ncbi:MAG: bifunctional hydroxymethylpyrimidine kinase/phosphomethylpyrimidine kinase [Pseudozobellia sp.]|nr:bifunctional hydroxymethylpyrimidine kinase/phosphomethylpyrimidine kinase [Pseudozobellia sp.]|tara:strand:- start:1771 stop:2607 length:837 start_codon:yes stop_codon:yes gene_type:complete